MASDSPSFYTRADLKARGWTPGLVSKFLGQPDSYRDQPQGRRVHLFLVSKVVQIECGNPAFVQAHERGRRRSAAREETNLQMRARVIDVARAIVLPVLSEAHDEKIKAWEMENVHLDPVARSRLAVEILVDTMKSLESPLSLYKSYSGVCEARTIHRNRVLNHILERYPHLEIAVQNKRTLLNDSGGLDW